MSEILPAIFFGHGNPMNALSDNHYTVGWRQIGTQTRRPKAILSISAHWFVPGTGVTISTSPRTIHDFGGFPPELYRVQYPAPGDPELARRVQSLLQPLPVKSDNAWGLDHGTWSVPVSYTHLCDGPKAGFGGASFFIATCAKASATRINTAKTTPAILFFILSLLRQRDGRPAAIVASPTQLSPAFPETASGYAYRSTAPLVCLHGRRQNSSEFPPPQTCRLLFFPGRAARGTKPCVRG